VCETENGIETAMSDAFINAERGGDFAADAPTMAETLETQEVATPPVV
jgi:hypothetical protein